MAGIWQNEALPVTIVVGLTCITEVCMTGLWSLLVNKAILLLLGEEMVMSVKND